ncbi:hypothetical protein WN55_02701 [Dufourea novaeangliae]|uniref:Uncharacterized protein n=1 Tax=Dufourea novaeangliae TaxID=178035 RepID=A0A154NZQ1_DUFNO|nr:hypothetical protein WN55_02701 [Dufourea novaeangliae]
MYIVQSVFPRRIAPSQEETCVDLYIALTGTQQCQALIVLFFFFFSSYLQLAALVLLVYCFSKGC